MGGPHGNRFTHARRHGGRSGGTVRDHRPWPVRFHWTPVAGATGYAIYRHELPPGGSFDLGLPLGEVEGAGTVSFEDRLGLESRRYFYSVVPLLGHEEGPTYITLEQQLRQAIAISEARYRGLVTEQGAAIGEDIRLVEKAYRLRDAD